MGIEPTHDVLISSQTLYCYATVPLQSGMAVHNLVWSHHCEKLMPCYNYMLCLTRSLARETLPQCYLPPSSGDFSAFTAAEAGTRFRLSCPCYHELWTGRKNSTLFSTPTFLFVRQFYNFCTFRNRNEYCTKYKIFNFTLTVHSDCLLKLKQQNCRLLLTVHSVELVAYNFHVFLLFSYLLSSLCWR